jgi:hypothetical protein
VQRLRRTVKLTEAMVAAGDTAHALTVLSPQHDPTRLDTEGHHRDGEWLADVWALLDLAPPRHLRGLHYAIVSAQAAKPDGKPYTNTDADWQWLQSGAAKAARWLGYLPFEWIIDVRSDEPTPPRLWTPPQASTSADYHVLMPDVDDLTPRAIAAGDFGRQPYHLVFVTEKSSLSDVLEPLADKYQADIYPMTGETSDTRIYQMARRATQDGRPMVVFYFADCDPSGWQMSISVTHKLSVLKVLDYPSLDFRVHRVGLTPDQVRQYGLPSTPLKPKEREKRGPAWREATGIEQTEVDALAALRPDLLRQITVEAMEPYFDRTLNRRARLAVQAWKRQAQQVIEQRLGAEHRQRREAVAQRLHALRDEAAEAIESVAVDLDELAGALPEPPIVSGEPLAEPGTPLCDSRWSFANRCRALIASKRYEDV